MIDKLVGMSERALKGAAIALFVLIFALVLTQILFRHFLNAPLIWSEELARYAFIWLCYIGWIMGHQHGDHIAIQLLRDRYRGATKRAFAFLVELGHILLAILLLWQGWKLMKRNLNVETITLFFPFAVVYAIVPVTALIIMAMSLSRMARILGLRR